MSALSKMHELQAIAECMQSLADTAIIGYDEDEWLSPIQTVEEYIEANSCTLYLRRDIVYPDAKDGLLCFYLSDAMVENEIELELQAFLGGKAIQLMRKINVYNVIKNDTNAPELAKSAIKYRKWTPKTHKKMMGLGIKLAESFLDDSILEIDLSKLKSIKLSEFRGLFRYYEALLYVHINQLNAL